MLFHERVRAAQAAGRLGTCTCWDCLRKIGLTPPYTIRDKHKTSDRPPVVMDGRIDPELVGDPGGVPQPSRAGSEHKQLKPEQAKDRAHLREAVRNREAI